MNDDFAGAWEKMSPGSSERSTTGVVLQTTITHLLLLLIFTYILTKCFQTYLLLHDSQQSNITTILSVIMIMIIAIMITIIAIMIMIIMT